MIRRAPPVWSSWKSPRRIQKERKYRRGMSIAATGYVDWSDWNPRYRVVRVRSLSSPSMIATLKLWKRTRARVQSQRTTRWPNQSWCARSCKYTSSRRQQSGPSYLTRRARWSDSSGQPEPRSYGSTPPDGDWPHVLTWEVRWRPPRFIPADGHNSNLQFYTS
jgi:hypothetical protein